MTLGDDWGKGEVVASWKSSVSAEVQWGDVRSLAFLGLPSYFLSLLPSKLEGISNNSKVFVFFPQNRFYSWRSGWEPGDFVNHTSIPCVFAWLPHFEVKEKNCTLCPMKLLLVNF